MKMVNVAIISIALIVLSSGNAVMGKTISGSESEYLGKTIGDIALAVCGSKDLKSVLVTESIIISGTRLDPREYPQNHIGPFNELNFNCEAPKLRVSVTSEKDLKSDGHEEKVKPSDAQERSSTVAPTISLEVIAGSLTDSETQEKLVSRSQLPVEKSMLAPTLSLGALEQSFQDSSRPVRSVGSVKNGGWHIEPSKKAVQKVSYSKGVPHSKKRVRSHPANVAGKNRYQVPFDPAQQKSAHDVSQAITKLYKSDMMTSAGMKHSVTEEPLAVRASLGCDGIISFQRGNKIVNTRPKALVLKENVVKTGRYISTKCMGDADSHTEEMRIFESDGQYMAMPMGSDNPIALDVENLTDAPAGMTDIAEEPDSYCFGSESGKYDKETYEAIVGGGASFGGGFSGVDGWAVLEAYCMVKRDADGGRHYLGVGTTLFGGKGSVDSWDYGYKGLVLRIPSYKWVSEDGGKKFIADLFLEATSDHGSDGMGYTNERNFTLGGIHLGYINDERHIAGEEFWTGYRLDISYAWVLSKSGSHQWEGVDIPDTSGLMESFGNRLTIGARVYIWDIPNTRNRVFGQIGYSRTIGQFDDTLGIFVGLEYDDGVASAWFGPVVDLRSGRVRGFVGAEVDFGLMHFKKKSAEQMAAANNEFQDRGKPSSGAKMTAQVSGQRKATPVIVAPKSRKNSLKSDSVFWSH